MLINRRRQDGRAIGDDPEREKRSRMHILFSLWGNKLTRLCWIGTWEHERGRCWTAAPKLPKHNQASRKEPRKQLLGWECLWVILLAQELDPYR